MLLAVEWTIGSVMNIVGVGEELLEWCQQWCGSEEATSVATVIGYSTLIAFHLEMALVEVKKRKGEEEEEEEMKGPPSQIWEEEF